MAWSFGDSFDLYAAAADATGSYWDVSTATGISIVAGRFAGSQAFRWTASANSILVKTSGVNDAVHHLVVSFQQTAAISGTNLGLYFELFDGATAQCTILFRSDGAIILASGGPGGSALATYTGAVPLANTWYAFEFEVKIDNAAGSFTVRKNGNSVADFTATALDTQASANAYANKFQIGMSLPVSQQIDDLFWRSDAASVAWMGDIRCYARMPASDASVTFSRTPTSFAQTPYTQSATASIAAGSARYSAFIAAYDGAIGSVMLSLNTGYTGNMKCSLFASSGSAPTTVLGSATPIVNPVIGSNTFTFATPVPIAKGTTYYAGFDSDTASGLWNTGGSVANGFISTTAYASFPVASPVSAGASAAMVCTLTITTGSNATVVNEAQQDAATSYVFDSNPGDADFYSIASIASTPATVIATTTRAYMQKSDAGTRTAAVQLKSGATTVASPTLTLSSSGWLWAWRMDLTDPATGAAWTPAGINNAQIGPKTIA